MFQLIRLAINFMTSYKQRKFKRNDYEIYTFNEKGKIHRICC